MKEALFHLAKCLDYALDFVPEYKEEEIQVAKQYLKATKDILKNVDCEYCSSETPMIKEVIVKKHWYAGYVEINMGIFIDRGYLRYVDLDDTNCLDHGLKFKINYCPVCGVKLRGM